MYSNDTISPEGVAFWYNLEKHRPSVVAQMHMTKPQNVFQYLRGILGKYSRLKNP